MLEKSQYSCKTMCEEMFEYGRRLGAIEGSFKVYINLSKRVRKISFETNKLPPSEGKDKMMAECKSIEDFIRDFFPYSDDMDFFINKYQHLGIRKLSEKVLQESEYTYF